MIMHGGVNNGCKSLEDKKCFYCPHCDNKIGKEHSSRSNAIIQFGLITGVYVIVRFINHFYKLPFYLDILLFMTLFYFALVVFIHLYPFQCYKKEIKEIKRESFESFYNPHDNLRIDGFEKKALKITVLIPIIFILMVFLILILIIFL